MNDILSGIFHWIEEDWKSNHVRFTLEVVAWALSIGCSLVMAFTVPNPLWITGCAIYSWCAYSRRSSGMLANYLLLTAIDTIGLVRIMT